MNFVFLSTNINDHSSIIVLKEMKLLQSKSKISLYLYKNVYGFKIISKEFVYFIDINEIFFPMSTIFFLIYINKTKEERTLSIKSKCLSLLYEKKN